jgi:hypothetical protein
MSSADDGHILSGHSWIVYQPDGGAPTTYGTWGNNPDNLGNGLHENLEAGRAADASRSTHLDDAQEAKLLAKIEEYRSKGADGWGYLSPCSTFAEDAWETATGEKLAHRSGGVISNPGKLKKSIEAANSGGPPAPQTQKSSSSSSGSPISSPVTSCTGSSSGKG